nr:hypothetical protein CFP56_34828 [Quercus suber]
MRSRLSLNLLLLALTCGEVVTGRQGQLHARQNNQDVITSTDASSTSSRTSTLPSTRVSQPSSSTTVSPSSRKNAISTSSASATLADSTSAMTSTDVTTSLSMTASPMPDGGELPLQPRVTPALGIAGVILMCAGVGLTLIGIKHKWVHIFLSTSILTALAVIVLIIYVMNPPVSDAIQGAYLVAAVFTGLVFGAVSLIFKEVTEGLGCLLGGFCLAMWFLVLRPGGLIPSTVGRAIFIACLAVAGFCLSFSRYTRNYGLIACTSFAGATITIIGIDCFNLNDNEFPLGTTSYPITRGIRVEIAVIPIICLLGILSQLKIWKIIKERRVRQDAEQAQKDESNQQFESQIGRSIETRNERDLAHWESVYGDNSGHYTSNKQIDSAVGSFINTEEKQSSVRERELDEIEMKDIQSTQSKRESKISLRQSISKRFSSLEAGPKSPAWAAPSQENLIEDRHEHDSEYRSESLSSSFSKRPLSVSGPVIVPLPFALPEEEENDKDAVSDNGSVEVARSVNDRRGIPLSRLSLHNDRNEQETIIPRIEHQRTYSLAATVDDAPDMDLLPDPRWSMHPSATPSPSDEKFDKNSLIPDDQVSINPRRLSRQTLAEDPLEENDEEALVRPIAVQEDALPTPSGRSSKESQKPDSRSTSNQENNTASVVGSLHEHHLPQGLSKVAQTYRTNEWAKHITDAEKPEPDHDLESTSPGIKVDPIFAEEAARPVPVDILTTTPVEREQVDRKASQSSSNAHRSSVQKPTLGSSSSAGRATPVYAFERSNSQTQISTHGGTVPAVRSPSGLALRGPPSPTTVRDPNTSEIAVPRNLSTPLGLASTANLMDQREDRLKRKVTTTSFSASNVAPNLNLTAPSDTASVANSRIESPIDNVEEEMTLAVRKAMMQQKQAEAPQYQQQQQSQPRRMSQTQPIAPSQSTSQPRSSSQTSFHPPPRSASQTRGEQPRTESRSSRRASNPQRSSTRRDSNGSRPALRTSQSLTPASQNLIYDSHQPKRSNTIDNERQSALQSQWRQSLEQHNKPQPFTAPTPAGPGLSEMQRQVDARREFLEREREKREMKREEAMRAGAMHEAHRDKLRKMQAQAADSEKLK